MEHKPKKSLGQNFLRDETVLQKIIDTAELNSDDVVFEVGPGEGVLTEQLAKYVRKIISIEKDEELAKKTALNFQFSIFNFQTISNDPILNFENKVAIILGDILAINLPALIKRNDFFNYKVVANIPYYITSPIIRLFLEQECQPQEIILMIQKEVAQRIVAKAGQNSILSISVQYYATAEIMFEVSKLAFSPVPKVDSAVIKIIPTRKFDKSKDKAFFRIIRAGFSAKRKTISNNLTNSLQLDKSIVEEKLKTLGIASNARAQELSVEDWEKLVLMF